MALQAVPVTAIEDKNITREKQVGHESTFDLHKAMVGWAIFIRVTVCVYVYTSRHPLPALAMNLSISVESALSRFK